MSCLKISQHSICVQSGSKPCKDLSDDGAGCSQHASKLLKNLQDLLGANESAKSERNVEAFQHLVAGSLSLHAKVSLDKILTRKMLLMVVPSAIKCVCVNGRFF